MMERTVTYSVGKERARFFAELLCLVIYGVWAGFTYPGHKWGIPWWVFALVAASSLTAITAQARLLPNLWDDA